MGDLNLIPNEVKESREKVAKTSKYGMVIAIAVAVLILAIAIPEWRLHHYKNQASDLKTKIENDKSSSESDKQAKEIADLNNSISKAQNLSKQRKSISGKITALSKLIPSTDSLKTLSYDGKKMTVTGTTSSYNSISEFAANLKMSSDLSGASVTSIVQDSGVYTFTITIDVVGGK